MEFIDLRSDTMTVPTQAMKEAMINAKVGDDVFGDDPTVIELQTMIAEKLGKEAALFVPSGTFGNQLAILTHCKPGQEVIIGDDTHIVLYECAAASVWSKTQFRTLDSNKGILDPTEIESKIRKNSHDIHIPETGLICLENPTNMGCVVPFDNLKKIHEIAIKYGIPIHLDGARLFNAAVALNVDVKEITQYVDSVMLCFSKGLCCPVGSMVVGSKDFIDRARKYRKMFGGTMRQTGILAASGIVALKEIVPRIKEDHEMAKLLALELSKFGDVISINVDEVYINTLFFTIKDEKIDPKSLVEYMLKHGIKFKLPRKNGIMRLMTHYYIKEEHVMKVVETFKNYVNEVVYKSA